MGTVPCDWCGKPVPQSRRWFARRRCTTAHRRGKRVMTAVGNLLAAVTS